MGKMQCFNFCEILENVMTVDQRVDTVIQKVMELAGYTECERIYVGSYFCSQYVLNLSTELIKKVILELKIIGMKITLVLPMFTEKDLERGKEKIHEFSAYFHKEIDEITVNDYGMLEYIHKKYQININLGRLMFKDYRDPRYEAYYRQSSKPKYFTRHLKQICEQYQVTGLELDVTHESIDLSEAPSDIEIAIHVPYCYMTVGMVCEFASIPYEITEKFRPNLPCNKECLRNRINYQMLEDRKYLKIGRTVYFEHRDGNISWDRDYREIYAPIDLEVEA